MVDAAGLRGAAGVAAAAPERPSPPRPPAAAALRVRRLQRRTIRHADSAGALLRLLPERQARAGAVKTRCLLSAVHIGFVSKSTLGDRYYHGGVATS